MKTPFFIVGSPRSGTTLLRNLLRGHPNLSCPEETHIFRWAEPFGSGDYTHVVTHVETLKYHRQLDKVSDEKFIALYEKSNNRKDLLLNYFKEFSKNNTNRQLRLFDKTPQHAYGLFLIHAFFPTAKFIHLVRNPLNVIASLKLGRQFNKQTLTGAINFWLEPIMLLNTFKQNNPELLLEIKYEDLTVRPEKNLQQILSFIEEPNELVVFETAHVHTEQNLYLDALSKQEVDTVKQQLQNYMELYGYL